ncbi:cell division protein DIVIC [Erysipelotrichaceae bacterium]|nr:cell division protein DIVIC [Erysipelotrichaceae bacterium]
MKQKKGHDSRKGIKRRIVFLKSLILLILTISLFYITQAAFSVMDEEQKFRKQEILLEQEHQRKIVLESDLQKLDDPEYVRQYAREKFHYTSEDEILFRLPKEEVLDEKTTENQ